jgi:DNA polymerase elongation subunit (family B)
MTANGYYFSKNKQGFIPEMLKKIYTMRKQYKGMMLEQDALYEKTQDTKHKILRDQYDSTQHALKIQINALYGALGNAWFRYFDIRMAEATTSTGQVVIKWTEKSVNKYLNTLLKTKGEDYVVGIDTDSVFVSLEAFVNKMYKGNVPEVHKVVDMISKFSDDKLIPMMAEGFAELTEYLNCYEPRLVIKNEVIGNKGIFVKRKRYVINVYSSEGVKYEEPKLKVRGLEIVRTSTPEVCRSAIKEAIKVMFDGGEEATQTYIKQFKKNFVNYSSLYRIWCGTFCKLYFRTRYNTVIRLCCSCCSTNYWIFSGSR